jgi:hypothetical protein
MYLGHIITESGMLLTTPSAGNLATVAFCWTYYAIRMHWESELIQSHLIGAWTLSRLETRVI